MDRQIAEVRSLATKYSKAELGRMVQMGLLDPQKAMMAGMMIDRIQKQNAQPPQTTVAEDVLGLPGMAQRQQQMQQPQPAGVEALPAGNIGEYAGGGIVALADGGEADIPGYKDAGYVKSEWTVPPAVQAARDQDRFGILAQELKDAEARLRAGDPRAPGDVEALRRDMRRLKPKVDPNAGIGALIAPAAARSAIIEDPMQQRGDGTARNIPPAIAGPASVTPGAEIPKATKTGSFGAYNVPEDQFPLQGYQEMLARRQEVVGSAEDKKPETFQPKVVEEPKPQPPGVITAEQIKVPDKKILKDEINQVREAYKEAGVDVDMYKNMMAELKEKKAGLGERKKQALGFALMSVGLGLTGSRQGQEFAVLGAEGQKALGTYMNSMEKILENDQQLDALNRQLAMAENNFKRTGADSALAQVRAREERIEQVEAKNAELRQAASVAQAQVGATVYGAQLGAEVRKDIMGMQAAAKVEAAKATAGKAGALTQKQEFDIRQQMKMELEPKLREQYKDIGSEAQINKKVQAELDKIIDAEIGKIRSRPAGYGGGAAPQDMFADWSVEGL